MSRYMYIRSTHSVYIKKVIISDYDIIAYQDTNILLSGMKSLKMGSKKGDGWGTVKIPEMTTKNLKQS